MIGNLPLICLIKFMPFPFLSIACPMWIVAYHLKYFVLQNKVVNVPISFDH